MPWRLFLGSLGHRLIQNLPAVNNGDHHNSLLLDAVNQPIAIYETLAQIRLAEFGPDTSRLGKLAQPRGNLVEFRDNRARVENRVARDVGRNRLDILQRLRRPGYDLISHLSSRASACAWDSAPSECARCSPRRIFLMT